MSWAKKYIGIPYKENGRTRTGADCWGLVRMVLKEERGIDLPSYAYGDDDKDRNNIIRHGVTEYGEKIDTPEPFAVVVLRVHNRPHIGICVDENTILHSDHKGVGSCLMRVKAPHVGMRLHEIYRANLR